MNDGRDEGVMESEMLCREERRRERWRKECGRECRSELFGTTECNGKCGSGLEND